MEFTQEIALDIVMLIITTIILILTPRIIEKMVESERAEDIIEIIWIIISTIAIIAIIPLLIYAIWGFMNFEIILTSIIIALHIIIYRCFVR